MPVVPRSPVMVPSPQARRGLAVVRRRRLLVEDGALVLAHEGGRREVLARPGDVVRATWSPVAAAVGLPQPFAMVHTRVTDVLVLERRGAPALVLHLSDWLPIGSRGPYDIVTGTEVAGWPGPPEEPLLSAAVRVSGAAAVVAALGLRLDSAAGQVPLDRLREALAAGRQEVRGVVDVPPVVRRLAVLAMLSIVAMLVPLIFGLVEPATALVFVQAMGLLGAAVVTARVVLHRQAAADLDAVRLPAPLWRPSPTVATSRRFVARSRLSAGADWLVVRDQHDREGWTPGPAQGGVTTVRASWPWLTFHDAEDARLWIIKADEWFAESELPGRLEQLRVAGYEIAGDAPPGPNDHWWAGTPIIPGPGRPQEPLGLLGQWSEGAYVACALAVAIQIGFQLQGGVTAPDAALGLAVAPAVAVLVGLVGLVRERQERRGTQVARPPAQQPA